MLKATLAAGFLLCLVAGAAQAQSQSNGRPVVIGQLPDVFFTPGVAATKTIGYSFVLSSTIPGGNYAVFAGAASAGIVVEQTYGGSPPYQASYPELTSVGPSGQAGIPSNWTINLKTTAGTPAGAYTIELFGFTNSIDDYLPTSFNRSDSFFLQTRRIGVINVYVKESPFAPTFVVAASAANTSGASTRIDHVFTDGNPNARIIVTQSADTGTKFPVINPHPLRAEYDAVAAKWRIKNADAATMPIGAVFNVHVEGAATVQHVSAAANITSNKTCLDNAVANDNPSALVFFTISAGASLATNNGVYYDTSSARWCIFTEDLTAFPPNVVFNVKVIGLPGTHTVSPGVYETFIQSGNNDATSTHITRSSTAHSSALLFITHNRNPPGAVVTNNNRPIAVRKDILALPVNWILFNSNGGAMSTSASFNVWEPMPPM